MFFLLPWRVDVPQDRWPVMNWLILVALVAVFAVQVADLLEYAAERDTRPPDMRQSGPRANAPAPPPAEPPPRPAREIPGITGKLILRGWSLPGLLGYMWLHGGLLHLFGNMFFLWIFGNAVCAKIGNLRYLGLYVLFGVAAGIAHLLLSPAAVLGASGAVYGVIGMYLVLFYQNEITCFFLIWLILPLYVRVFAISGIWLILFRLVWDLVGALTPGGSNVAYFAHLGGFGAGFGIAFWMCRKGWITMEKYERSLLQAWEERTRGKEKDPLDATCARLGLHLTDEQRERPEAEGDSQTRPIAFGNPGTGGDRTVERPTVARLGVSRARAPAVPRASGPRLEGGTLSTRAGKMPATPRAAQPPDDGMASPKHEPPPPPPAEPPPVPGRPETRTFIRTACGCGYAIRVTRQYAGRTVRCPSCRQPVVIPAQTDFFGPAPQPAHGTALLSRAGDDLIRFLCTCGRRIKVPVQYAGRTCRCPQCHTPLRIPGGP